MIRLRRRLYAILEDHEERGRLARAADGFLITLILANAVAVVLESMPAVALRHGHAFTAFEAVSVAVFTVEYALRLWVAPENPVWTTGGAWRARLRQAASPMGLIDLLAILPFYAGHLLGLDLRALRLFRALRILKLTRYSPALATMTTVLRKESRAILGAFMILAVVVVIAATLIHYLEGPGQPAVFGTIPKAMWWAIETLTTVGYGDAVPQTASGRLIGAVVMLLGIGVFVMWTSIFAVGFLEETRRQSFVVTWQLVARVPVFARLDAVRIAEIAGLLTPETVPPRFTVLRRGAIADSMYFIAAGDVEVDLPGRVLTLGAGHFFGELALIERTPHQATVTTLTECRLLRLDGAHFQHLMEAEPELRAEIMRIAAERRRHGLATLAEDDGAGG